MRLTSPLILWNYFSPLMILAAYPAEELGMHNNPECTGRVYLFDTSNLCENKCRAFVRTYGRACWGCSERRYELADNCCECQCPVLDRTWHSSSCEDPKDCHHATTANDLLRLNARRCNARIVMLSTTR
ncbi:uncharacterized protein PGTG_18368 [Puccinia graminis f. sp. tritici CRL 75-36-700-3]|uniref:TNFR-Cys domain-containing protein n=1 Tax=Puccinia graminis f. sp. tritici (strain CRL 75-36-700-3 / race SCCL) TaxID=418459 RepID=E3L758_PUCGT|nr:uncharacterized protein PGTG_18368 [Puccinia graminis f. sp. tritici CRL 75-36-700-3]EFP92381.1 hypothetical protein PGTG_18368 [Puccinia graminis f. sp. tritici CRL 75-36-700-3]